MNKSEFVQLLVKRNDVKLRNIESRREEEVDLLYQKSVAKAIQKFRELEKVSPDEKEESKKVQKILDDVIAEFNSEFEKLVTPIQEATQESYDDGLEETALLLAAGKGEPESEPKKKRGRKKKSDKG